MNPTEQMLAIHLLIVVTCAGATCGAEAQRPTRDPARLHAAVCVGELGWRASDEACAAIVAVHVRLADRRGVSPERVARAYSAALRRPPAHRRWVAGLPASSESRRPEGWPRRIRWAPHRDQYLRYVAAAESALAEHRASGDVSVCPGAVHYGSTADGRPTGHELACSFAAGRRVQHFWKAL